LVLDWWPLGRVTGHETWRWLTGTNFMKPENRTLSPLSPVLRGEGRKSVCPLFSEYRGEGRKGPASYSRETPIASPLRGKLYCHSFCSKLRRLHCSGRASALGNSTCQRCYSLCKLPRTHHLAVRAHRLLSL